MYVEYARYRRGFQISRPGSSQYSLRHSTDNGRKQSIGEFRAEETQLQPFGRVEVHQRRLRAEQKNRRYIGYRIQDRSAYKCLRQTTQRSRSSAAAYIHQRRGVAAEVCRHRRIQQRTKRHRQIDNRRGKETICRTTRLQRKKIDSAIQPLVEQGNSRYCSIAYRRRVLPTHDNTYRQRRWSCGGFG